jgi:WD40 repeat protein
MQPDAPSYIVRKADNELYERTLAGDFCYVLTPRQMGKSSLMARTAYRLKKQGIQTVIIDLTQIGSERGKESAGQWYCGIADRVIDELSIEVDIGKWWEERKHLPALQRLTRFFRDVVLARVKEHVVIFVDEIDTTVSLPFTDDFFAAIRACYNARATEPLYGRLSFVLLGVAAPSQLIKDSRRTPFNIGYRIELTDFKPEEALPLSAGLGKDQVNNEEALKRILYWTGGHPYLTQKLCRMTVGEKPEVYSNEYIDGLVGKYFLSPEASQQDDNLNFVRDRLVHKKNPVRRILKLYRHILKGGTIIDEPLSLIHTVLKLSGLVMPRANRQLCVRNRIYERTFTMDWINKVLPIDWDMIIPIVSIAAILLVIVITIEVIIPLQYINTIRTARDDVPILEYNTLREIPGYSATAKNIFAEYWDRRALRAEAEEKRDEAVLYRLQALKVKDTERRRREVSRCTKNDYENLIATYRHNKGVLDFAFSPDGRTLITGSRDGTARMWRSDTGEPVGKTMKQANNIHAVAFSPDGRTVLTGSSGIVRLWRADTGEPVEKPLIHDKPVYDVSFSPDGRTVLTGSYDGTARLWRADTGEPVGNIMKHKGSVDAVAFSPDGRTVLTGSYDKTAQLWRVDTGKPVGKPMIHNRIVRDVAFSSDGRIVLTGSDDDTARFWRADTGESVGKIIRPGSSVYAVAFSPDGRTVLTGGFDGTALLWRVDTGELVGKPMTHDDRILAVAFSPDGRTVLTGSGDGTARLWRLDIGEPEGKIIKHEGGVYVVSFSPDGSIVLTGGFDGKARLWQTNTGQPVGKYIIHGARVYAVAFSPDGHTLLTENGDTARLWQADTGEPVGKPMKHGDDIITVSFSPDGRTVLTGGFDGTTRFWRADTGEPLGKIIKNGWGVVVLAFSPDGSTVFTGVAFTGRLWRTDTGDPVGKVMVHTDKIRAVAFSPDGRTVITGSYGRKAWLWRADTGDPLGKPIRHRIDFSNIAFSPDGLTVITMNSNWIHQSVLSGEKLHPKASRLLPGPCIGPYAFLKTFESYRFMDDKGDKMQVAVRVTEDTIKIVTLHLDIPNAPPIEGDPDQLLEEWQKKLSLKLDKKTGKIEPMYPLPSEKDKSPFPRVKIENK